jgi:hypothetical protein
VSQADYPFIAHHGVADVQSVLIGTDGALDIEPGLNIPGKNEELGDISQFWCKDYFSNPDSIRRRLALANLSKPQIENGILGKTSPLLRDDTSIIVVRRKV